MADPSAAGDPEPRETRAPAASRAITREGGAAGQVRDLACSILDKIMRGATGVFGQTFPYHGMADDGTAPCVALWNGGRSRGRRDFSP